MTDFKKTFNIIKHRGSPKEAVTLWGTKVYRKDKIFIPEYENFVICADYDNHFIYEVPDSKETAGIPSFLCTCGAFGIIVAYSGYKQDASKQDLPMLVCYLHANTGHHATGKDRWI